jgi:hypothetical protein
MKKPLVFLFLLSLGVLMSACKDDEDKVPNRTIFTFTLNSWDSMDYWIIIRDNENGDLIEERRLTVDNRSLVFESTKPLKNNKIDVTLFQISNGVVADIYAGIDIGAEWTWPYKSVPVTQPNTGGDAGVYSLKIINVPSLFSFNVSDKFGNRLNYHEGQDHLFSAKTITCTPNITGNGHTQLVSIDTGTGKQKYAMIDNVSVGTVTLDYSAFKEYDRYVNFTFPGTNSLSSLVYGQGGEDPYINYYSYIIQQYWSNSAKPWEKSELNIGVLNSIDKYRIDLDVSGTYHYTSFGPAPASIQYVDPASYSVSATTIHDYSITSSTPFTFRVANFGYLDGKSVQFYYHAPAGYTGKHHDPISSSMAEV